MIPIKIISVKEAIKAGLTNEKGFGVVAAGVVVREENGKQTVSEKTIIKANGEIELVFMSEERKAEFKREGTLKDYVSQFKKIPENVKKDIN